MLSEESDASRRETRDGSRITPANYKFNVVGRETLDTGPAYVLAIIPKTENRHLIDGKIWVNAKDYSIVRIEGQPAKSPSFWIKSVHFVHTYTKQGPFWLPLSDNSVTDVRIFGATGLKIDYFGYVPNVSVSAALNEPGKRSMP